MGCAFFFLSFVLLHDYWIGEPFESFLSIIVTTYLVICTSAFPYITKELDRIDSYMERLSWLAHSVYKILFVLLYFVAPVVYIWLNFFEEKER